MLVIIKSVLVLVGEIIFFGLLAFFAVMSCILNSEEKEQRKQQGTQYNPDKTCNSCENYKECLATDYKCRYEYQKYYKEKRK